MVDRIERERSGSMGIVGVIVGALIVIAVAFYLISGGTFGSGTSSTTINNTAPAVTPAPARSGSTSGAAAPATPAAPAAPNGATGNGSR